MANYDVSGVHLLNRYVLDNLYRDRIITKTDYKLNGVAVDPFIPAQQVPEFNAMGKPFVVYNYQSTPDNDFWITPRDNAVYVIYGNELEVRRIYNYIYNLVNRQDITRNEINDFIDLQPTSSPFLHWEFKHIYVTSAQGPDPYTQEGGRQAASILMTFQYAVPLDPSKNYMRL